MPNNPRPSNPAGKVKRDLYEHRQWVRGVLIALVVIDGLFLFFSFRPLGRSFAAQQEELKSLREDARAKRDSVARLRKIEATLKESAKLGDQFYSTKFLPAETGFATIMEEVERLANSSGVRKSSVSYGVQEIQGRPDLEGVTIDTTIDGDYAKIVRFVNQLEQSQLFLIVDSLGVQSSTTGKATKVAVTVKLLTLFRMPKGMPVPGEVKPSPAPEAKPDDAPPPPATKPFDTKPSGGKVAQLNPAPQGDAR